MNNKVKTFSAVLLTMLTLTGVTYAFDFDKKFDVSVLKPVQNKYQPVKQEDVKIVPVVEQKKVVQDVVVQKSVNDFETQKSYDEENGVVCYRPTMVLASSAYFSCVKVK